MPAPPSPATAALQGRHAVITGGGRGIGRAIATTLAGAGARLTLLGRTESALAGTAAALAGLTTVDTAVADVTDEGGLAAALAAAQARQPVDILINNAGGVDSRPLRDLDADHLRAALEWNVVPVLTASRAVLPAMRAAGWGRIVTVASTAGLKGYAYVAAYCAAKHAVIGLTRAMAVELARTGVTVNAVCPGYTDTELLDRAIATLVARTGQEADAARAALLRDNPQGRPTRPDEVAAAVLWLCGPGSDTVTGQALSLSGGEVMN